MDAIDFPRINAAITVHRYWVNSRLYHIHGTQFDHFLRHSVVTIRLTPEEANIYRKVPVVYNQATRFYIFPVGECDYRGLKNALTVVMFLA